MEKLKKILEEIYKEDLVLEVYDALYISIINKYKKLKKENAHRRSCMIIARKLNKGKDKEIDAILEEDNSYYE